MKTILIHLLLFTLLTSSTICAQSGSSSFEFLLIGPGARAAAMGEALTSVSGDADAPYFNPASAAVMSGTEFSFTHVSYLTDVTQEHLTIRAGKGKFHYGIGMFYGSTANIERRGDTPSQNPLGTFDEHNFTAMFNWAMPVSGRISIGNSVKWAYEKLDLESASALAIDLGGFYALSPNITLGSSLRNLGTRPKFINKSFDLPREWRLGASYRNRNDSSQNSIVLAVDYILTNWGNKSSKVNFGGEYLYADLVTLRAGYSAGYDSRGFAVGGGLTYNNYFIDYAFVPAKNNLGDTHRVTLRVRL